MISIQKPLQGHGHSAVMVDGAVEFLIGGEPSVAVDGTAGGGGHLAALRNALPRSSVVLGVDRDPSAMAELDERFEEAEGMVLRCGSYADIGAFLAEAGLDGADAALFDLGFSSIQLDDPSRGFSYRLKGPLDMRYDTRTQTTTAADLVNRLSAEELADLIYNYGQERRSRRIARSILSARPLETTEELVAAVNRATRGFRTKVLSRVFQALRIAVNDELGELDRLICRLADWMRPRGRICFITFHSLEDRRIKRLFRDGDDFAEASPPWVVPSEEECKRNPRARSARMRMGYRT